MYQLTIGPARVHDLNQNGVHSDLVPRDHTFGRVLSNNARIVAKEVASLLTVVKKQQIIGV
jgi:hypothetical protein